ncbi:hypothetical protein SAMN05660226_02348 [Parapedobacter luteus]|uniref:Uncharacterized protein n=1 Tax=Parapedobacter luteus TaxID=623280 RepID=A0A1T5CU73_9SPHI|nr:hypothetical protein SAMN05660226_02348 [Parapedobacter luteus]
MQANDKSRPRRIGSGLVYRRRDRRSRWSTRLITKLAVAPTAARMAVFSSSSVPMWGRALSSVPAAVPSLRSWRIGSLRFAVFLGRHTRWRIGLQVEAFPKTQRQAHVLGRGHYLGR